jgi:hypothetical protein
MALLLPFWQKLLITISVMLATSYVAGLAWDAVLNVSFPNYLAALPVWDFLKRIRPS